MRYTLILFCILVFTACSSTQRIEIPADEIRDKIAGGIIGQFFGNLNGLEHENKYTDEPGNVTAYTPDLSGGAFTDDDTDIEFVYIYHMLENGQIFLPYAEIRDLWMENLENYIYCSNKYARNLMEIGFEPPSTGRIVFNPWAVFNISGQFLCEQFALISPGMPQTAARIGTHYTHVAVDGEPIQTTQLYTAMIATAFFEENIMKIIDAGLAAVDPGSEIHDIVSNVIAWYRSNPDDWRATRLAIKDAYWSGTFGGKGGSNGYRIITAATIGSLLYGEGDFVEAIRHSFNFGWDADNISAMVGTIMGTMKGEAWIREQGWPIKDEYRNTRRPGLPKDLTITDFIDLHVRLAEEVIEYNGGIVSEQDGKKYYAIPLEEPANVERLPDPLHRIQALRQEWLPIIERNIHGDARQKARAVYAASCLGLVAHVAAGNTSAWEEALPETRVFYEKSIKTQLWDSLAKQYFHDVLIEGNIQPEYPFDYD